MDITGPAEIGNAVGRARNAQVRWKQFSFFERARIVSAFHDLILDRRELILDTIQSETGKARRDALAELVTVAGTARYYLTHGARHLQLRRRRPAVPGMTSAEIVYKPHGVVGLITPWNYPFLLGVADALPALLAGNAVITKPSEQAPLSAALGRDLLIESGLDPNLALVVHGGGDVASELIRHVDYVGFTGSTETGRKVAIAAAERLIPCSLELGGKNAMIVLAGAPLKDAVSGVMAGAFSNGGQSCISVERIYVQDSIYDQFSQQLVEKTATLKLGWSRGWDIDMGSLISRQHAGKVLASIQQAVDAGARILIGGHSQPELGPSFIAPTILANVTDEMAISSEETFGPVIALYRVQNADEAIERANRSRFGLNASVWPGPTTEAHKVARLLETGSVGINSTLLIYNSFDVSMGGVKESGLGRRHGKEGILRYTEAQSIVKSVAAGGGYDALMLRTNSERKVKVVLSLLKIWRRIPWLR